MQKYDPKKIEKKWQKFWEKNKTFEVKEDSKKQKFYSLIEFPYPSGAGLHVGHPRPFTAMDVVSRKRRMEGYNVLYPIGFDAFGLPTENYAIKTGRPPAEVTAENIANFTRQLKSLGYSFDWSRAVDTTDPKYYKWTQWIFLQFFKHGLAYKKMTQINWCPKDKIGLANEEAAGGVCDRCGGPVEKRDKEQWMLAITKYADKLLDGLKEVDYIPQARTQQENWIGRSEGAEVSFELNFKKNPDDNKRRGLDGKPAHLEVFTTRPDTLFGTTYLVLAPEHLWVVLATDDKHDVLENKAEVKAYLASVRGRTDMERSAVGKEKSGVELKGVRAINPATKEVISIWVADYVLPQYGTGAIMAVPAHDERDFEFAKKYNLPIKKVIKPPQVIPISPFQGARSPGGIGTLQGDIESECFPNEGISINSDFLNGLPTPEAKEKIIKWLEEKELGKRQVNYKLRDWVFSRQRYWGEPIPLVKCEKCADWIPLPESELPLKLPSVEKYQPTDTGESPLSAMTKWVNTKCPRCGSPAKRETDTMPNWAGSSWYFLRYCDPHNDKEFASMEKLRYWMGPVIASEAKQSHDRSANLANEISSEIKGIATSPRRYVGAPRNDIGGVDWYNGGMEHTVLHLLYSRFWNQFLFDIGVVPTREPYKKRTSHGMILGPDGEKMSKSRGNVINPDEMVEQFGADAFRTYIGFMGPFDQAVKWDTNGLVGVRRFLERVWVLYTKVYTGPPLKDLHLTADETSKLNKQKSELDTLLHQTIKKVSEDIEAMRFNTAISQLMILTNRLFNFPYPISRNDFEILLRLLSPFAPHLSEELWEIISNKNSISVATWPQFDPELAKDSTLTLAMQVNGKVRDELQVPAEISEAEVKKLALASEKIQKWLGGKAPKKVIYVKGKLVSVVV